MRKISFILFLLTPFIYLSAQEFNEAYLESLPEAVREDIKERKSTNWTVLVKNTPASNLSFAPQFLAMSAVEPAKTPVKTACKINVTL